MYSDVQVNGGFIRELHFFDTKNFTVHLIVDWRQVTSSRTLTDTTEFVIHRTVAETNPSLVCSEVRHRNAAKMCADSRAHDDI